MTLLHAPPEVDLSDGLWLSLAELARLKGVSRQAISKRVDRLKADGKIVTKPGPGGTKLVNLAQYNLAVNEVGDAAKELGAETRTANVADDDGVTDTPVGDPTFRDAQAREKKYKADLAELEVRQRLGELVPTADIAEAAAACAGMIVQVIDRLPARADEMASAVSRDGSAGARALLRIIARDLRTDLVSALRGIIEAAKGPDAAETARLPHLLPM